MFSLINRAVPTFVLNSFRFLLNRVAGTPLAALVNEERILAFVEDAEETVTETSESF